MEVKSISYTLLWVIVWYRGLKHKTLLNYGLIYKNELYKLLIISNTEYLDRGWQELKYELETFCYYAMKQVTQQSLM